MHALAIAIETGLPPNCDVLEILCRKSIVNESKVYVRFIVISSNGVHLAIFEDRHHVLHFKGEYLPY